MGDVGTKRAVLVGCNYPNTRFRLHGCINDVSHMKNVIETNFGFNPNNVKILTDDGSLDLLPTRENIMKALNDMVTQAKVGDVLFFHFSGHGTLIPSLEPGQRYREGEAIVPCDLNLITDMDLKDLIVRLDGKASFTMLSDSCHSGGLIDKDEEQIGPHIQTGKPHPVYHCKTRGLSIASIIPVLYTVGGYVNNAVNDLTGSSILEHLGNALTSIFKKETSIQFQPHDQRSFDIRRSLKKDEGILLSGCQANETSADVLDNENKPHGAFTNAVLRVLKQHKPSGETKALTNRSLVIEVRRVLQDEGYDQHPCLYCSETNADATFLETQPADKNKEYPTRPAPPKCNCGHNYDNPFN